METEAQNRVPGRALPPRSHHTPVHLGHHLSSQGFLNLTSPIRKAKRLDPDIETCHRWVLSPGLLSWSGNPPKPEGDSVSAPRPLAGEFL